MTEPAAYSGNFIDELGREIQLDQPPRSIISLVPSQTEFLFDLGLKEEVVGITKFCVHPEHWSKEKTIVGGTKRIHFDRIADLKPDLIIANKEENTQEDIEQLMKQWPVWISDIKTLEDAYRMMDSIGALVDRRSQAQRLIKEVQLEMSSLEGLSQSNLSVIYLIWKNPYMAAGRKTFIQEMLQLAGFSNAIPDKQSRYPEMEVDAMKALKPDLLLLSSEPFPFKGKHLEAVRKDFPEIPFCTVDGELFSWYGSRMRHFARYVHELRKEISHLSSTS